MIFKMLLQHSFIHEISSLKSNTTIHISSSLFKLDPFLDTDGVLKVGARLKRSMLDINEVHPVILPKANLITEAIVTWCLENVEHSSRSMTVNNLRKNGLWVISANSVVEQSLDVLLVVSYVGHLDFKKWQIYQKADALKRHHSFTVEWICLDLLLSEKEDHI